jgi:hypothetical protein
VLSLCRLLAYLMPPSFSLVELLNAHNLFFEPQAQN